MTFPHTATVQRKTKTGTLYEFGAAGSIQCFLQPLDSQSAQAYGITFTKGYNCYIPFTADVKEGDRLVIDSITYGVAGLKSRPYGNLAHKQFMLELV